MERLIHWLAEFVTNPMNILVVFLIWVGIPIITSGEPLDIKALMFALMMIPATLGYMIGRRK